jgi:hypothetical protein
VSYEKLKPGDRVVVDLSVFSRFFAGNKVGSKYDDDFLHPAVVLELTGRGRMLLVRYDEKPDIIEWVHEHSVDLRNEPVHEPIVVVPTVEVKPRWYKRWFGRNE